ncbi:hypothetical protein EC841_10165 [Raoultella ornithinolytica]|jgi:hypothetical protein|uniref:Uncharacterized protein n=1 Tax=Raoultella ornithinolytica TaxID=54291 RepID=A0ABD7QN16_RAOOR|nr:hypothetical protein [Raoultella terrigena]TCQ76256.1 hypothetical protein EC841_10165 [Raoultella ornithinolytica]SUQ57664.1 Uncharacterised protein [Raoultella terrigena]
MTIADDLSRLAQVLNGASSRVEASYTVICLEESIITVNSPEIIRLLQSLGYKKATDCIEKNEVWLDRQALSWNDSLIYENIESFWSRVNTLSSLPNNYIIGTPLIFPATKNESIEKIHIFFMWKDILSLISDHHNNDCSVLFFTNDNKSFTVELKHSLQYSEIESLSNASLKYEIIKELFDTIKIKDLHKSERKLVIRSAINEVFKANSLFNFLDLLNSTEHIRKKYDELYEVYTKRFSVNKILNELDEKNLEFTSKINEFISSNQTKALTIPGALIAAGGLVKANETTEAILIIVGLWMIKRVNYISVEIFNETFDNLRFRVESAFDKYLKFEENKEIKDSADSIKSSIIGLIDKAKNRMRTVKHLASAMFYGGLIYVGYKQFPAFFEKSTVNLFYFLCHTLSKHC